MEQLAEQYVRDRFPWFSIRQKGRSDDYARKLNTLKSLSQQVSDHFFSRKKVLNLMKIGFWGKGGRQGLRKSKMTLENDCELLFPHLHLLSANITSIHHFAWVYMVLSIKPRAPHLSTLPTEGPTDHLFVV